MNTFREKRTETGAIEAYIFEHPDGSSQTIAVGPVGNNGEYDALVQRMEDGDPTLTILPPLPKPELPYTARRQAAYGSVQDQLDMIFWDGENGTTVWRDHIASVKAAHPKPA